MQRLVYTVDIEEEYIGLDTLFAMFDLCSRNDTESGESLTENEQKKE